MSKTKSIPKTPKKTLEAIRRYNDKNIVQIHLALNRKTDADILSWLEQKKNKQGYIKQLIRNELVYTELIKNDTKAQCEAKKDNG